MTNTRDIWGTPYQTEERRNESVRRRTVLKTGDESKVLGGTSVKEQRNETTGVTEEEYHIVMADDGVITTTEPQDTRYPHIAGKDYLGNLVSAGNLHRCVYKGCNRMVSNLSGVECEPGVWRCTKHYKIYDIVEFIKTLLSPFFNFKKDNKTQTPNIPSQGDNNVPEKR